MIQSDLQQAGLLGLNEVLVCTGFRTNIDLLGNIISIDYFFSKCVQGLNNALQEVSSHVKTFTNFDLRQDIDLSNGQPINEDVQVLVLDGEGNPVLDENGQETFTIESQSKLIGTIDFWMKTIGGIVIPDLQNTLDNRVIEFKR